jgi:hypothetical protein
MGVLYYYSPFFDVKDIASNQLALNLPSEKTTPIQDDAAKNNAPLANGSEIPRLSKIATEPEITQAPNATNTISANHPADKSYSKIDKPMPALAKLKQPILSDAAPISASLMMAEDSTMGINNKTIAYVGEFIELENTHQQETKTPTLLKTPSPSLQMES